MGTASMRPRAKNRTWRSRSRPCPIFRCLLRSPLRRPAECGNLLTPNHRRSPWSPMTLLELSTGALSAVSALVPALEDAMNTADPTAITDVAYDTAHDDHRHWASRTDQLEQVVEHAKRAMAAMS